MLKSTNYADCLNMETKMDGNNMETPKLAAKTKIGREAAKMRGLYKRA